MSEYFPSNEAEFMEWLATFVTVFANSGQAHGFVAAEQAAMQTHFDNLRTARQAMLAAEDALEAARSARDGARAALLAQLRPTVQRLQAARTMTDEIRRTFGISVRGPRQATSAPAEAPAVELDRSEPLRHVLRLSGRRPAGAVGAEVWRKVGGETPPTFEQMSMLGLHTNHRLAVDFAAPELGQRCWYALRWINRRGQPGPWSEMLTATVAA